MIRAIIVIVLLGAACDPGGPAEGACDDGDRLCSGDQEFQECVDGEWTEPTRCPPEGEPPLEIITYCNDGLCTP